MKTTLQLAFFICSLFFISTSTSRAQLPCSCVTRWTGGDEWGANGTLIQNPHPGGGVVRCANSAETEAQVKPICPYDAAAFPISTTYGAPKNGQKIAWFNFDAQANAGTFEWQIVSNDDMVYALFRSTVSTTALKNNLSGDCSQLEYVGCGTDFNGWKDFPFVNSEFRGKATNYYMLFWDKTPTGPSGDNFDLRFKARRGCSDNIPCSIKSDLTKPNTVACTNGKYQACFFVEGFNGNFKVATTPAYETVSVVYTNENGTISTDPTPTEITFGCTAGMGLKAQLCFTFPTSIYPTASSVSLQILGTKTVCGTSSCVSAALLAPYSHIARRHR